MISGKEPKTDLYAHLLGHKFDPISLSRFSKI